MMVAISSTVLTGWAGQLSLGQFAFVGVGAYATGYYAQQLPYPGGVGHSAPRGASGSRSSSACPRCGCRASTLAIITLGFAVVVSIYWLFGLDRLEQRVHRAFDGASSTATFLGRGTW